jgi:hypothetical protein
MVVSMGASIVVGVSKGAGEGVGAGVVAGADNGGSLGPQAMSMKDAKIVVARINLFSLRPH